MASQTSRNLKGGEIFDQLSDCQRLEKLWHCILLISYFLVNLSISLLCIRLIQYVTTQLIIRYYLSRGSFVEQLFKSLASDLCIKFINLMSGHLSSSFTLKLLRL